jgi:hypothetical protein
MHIPFSPKITCPNSQGYGANLDTQIILSTHKENSFNMLELPSCERNSIKYFINILRAYGLNHQRSSNIERVESCRSKTQVVLANQRKQGRHLKIAKKRSTKDRSTKSRD